MTKAVVTKVETISPAKAKQWLGNGANGNRRVSRQRVLQYQMEILSGSWDLNGAAIVFDSNGGLLDGQHRLRAVVKADKSIKSVVVRGVPPRGRGTLDTGKARNVPDLIHMHGASTKNTSVVSAAILLYHHWHLGNFDRLHEMMSYKAPPHVIFETYQKNKDIHDAAGGSMQGTKVWIGVCPPSVAVFCHYVFWKQNKTKADAFIAQFRDGVGLTQESPVLWLRNRMRSLYNKTQRAGRTFTNSTRLQIVSWFFVAWSAYRDEKPLPEKYKRGRKVWRPGEKFPRI